MTERVPDWIRIATYGAGYEADLAVARLDAAGIEAIRRGNDTVGLFGPGFEGRTPRGFDVLVLEDVAAEAREVLGPIDGPSDAQSD